ncbi:MAG: hypothetical protein ACRC7S_18910 [Cetobacterium sp.]
MKIKDKVEVVSYWEELKGEIGEVVESNGERVLVYFGKLEEGKEISCGVRLHNGFVSGRVKKHLFIQKQHLKVVETENNIENKTFNAQNTIINIAGININCKDTPCMFATKNWNVKEDKMEEIRVVRKLEDLDGMENGIGLKLRIEKILEVDKVSKELTVCEINGLKSLGWNFKDVDYNLLTLIKSLGFKFEYKPLRTEQEVKKEIVSLKSLPFIQEKANYYVGYNSLINKYLVICDSVNGHGLHIYMTEEQAQKYTDELNEILKNK